MRRTLQRNPHMRHAPHHDDADFAQDEGVRAYLCVCVSVCSSRTRLVLEGCENSVVCCGRACRRFIYAFVCVCVCLLFATTATTLTRLGTSASGGCSDKNIITYHREWRMASSFMHVCAVPGRITAATHSGVRCACVSPTHNSLTHISRHIKVMEFRMM